MQAYRAPWVLPVSTPPIQDGVVVVDGRVVSGVGPASELLPRLGSTAVTELPHHVLMPGLVNAHTHLALTAERDRHPQGRGLFAWLRSLVPATREYSPEAVTAGVREGLDQCVTLGTALVGDIVTRFEGVDALATDHRVLARGFLEVLGLDASRSRELLAQALNILNTRSLPDHVRLGLSPHAPYSLHRDVWAETVRAAETAGVPWTSHVGESPAERNYLVQGTGELKLFLEELGIPREQRVPWGNPALSMLEHMEALDGLCVHGVDLTVEEMDRLAVYDTPLCLCPGSNAWLGLPPAEVSTLFRRGVMLCLGTDSLASNTSLSLWEEMRRVRRLAPEIPALDILTMATAHGAMALQFKDLAGSLHPGSESRILAVDLRGATDEPPWETLVREPVEGDLTHLGLWAGDAESHLVK